jgi:hypothetical protein
MTITSSPEGGVLDGLPRTELTVEHLMDIEIRFRETQVFRTPVTYRLIAVVDGGTFTGPRLRGEVLPGGGDWLVMGEDSICRLDVRASLRTDDGEYLYLTNTGRVVLNGPEAGQRYLAGETLRAEHMHARTAPLFETGGSSYGWLNGTVNVGFVELSRSHISYRVYTVH